MTYPEQLETIEWKNKRTKILQRDGHKCQHCLNEKLISKLNKGLFSGYCFPSSKEAIQLENLGAKKYMRAGIEKKYSRFLNEPVVVYSKRIPKWRRMVIGVRNFDPDERHLYESYALKIKEVKNKWVNTINHDYLKQRISLEMELIEKRRLEFLNLNLKKTGHEFDWIFMQGLHIHHKYYINEFMAWEYDNDALITLCETCHQELHKNQNVPVYNSEMELLGHYHYCKRCHGAGVFPEYSHVDNGICFRCKGSRYEDLVNNKN